MQSLLLEDKYDVETMLDILLRHGYKVKITATYCDGEGNKQEELVLYNVEFEKEAV